MRIEDRRLTRENAREREIICCPGGLEVKGKSLTGDIEAAVTWRMEMLKLGMSGFVSYQDGVARGFIEYSPAETAPLPIEAPGAAVLMCYHWIPMDKTDEREHLAQERRLIELMIEHAKGKFSGIASLGWDHPTHFSIEMLRELGFREVERHDYLALMWLPFRAKIQPPELAPTSFQPQDLTPEGLLSVEVGWSNRCPYSIHHAARVNQAIAELPKGSRQHIRCTFHRIDTRADALRFCRHPWDWDWLFLNGTPVEHWKTTPEDLRQAVRESLERLEERR